MNRLMLAEPMRTMLDAIPDAVFIVHPETLQIVHANHFAEQITGLAADELQQRGLPDLHPEQARADTMEKLAHLHDNETASIEYKAILTPSQAPGRTVAVRISRTTLDGQAWLFAVARDINELCDVEQQLQENTILYHSLIAGLSDLMFRITEDGIYRDFHIPETSNLESPPPDAIIGKHVREVVPEHVTQAVMPVIQHVIQTRTIGTVEYSIEEHDGLRHYEARFVPSIANEIIAVVRDITQRKRETDILRDNEKMARALINASGDSAVLIDRDWTILAINDIAAERLGHTPEDMLNNCLLDYFPPETAKAREARVQTLLATKQPIRFSDTRQDRIFYNRVSPILDKNGDVARIAIFARDITKQRQDEAELKHQSMLFKAVAEATRCLLAPGHYKQTMLEAMAILGQTAKVDRMVVFENRPHPETGVPILDECCLWENDTLPDHARATLPTADRRAHDSFQHWSAHLKAGDSVGGPVSQLSETERSLLRVPDGQLSVLAVPIFVNRIFWGFIRLDDCQRERQWTDAEINAVRTMAASLGSAIARMQIESDLRDETRFIDTVRRIGNSLTLTRNPEDVLGQLLVQIRSVIPYQTANALLLDGETAHIVASHRHEQIDDTTDKQPCACVNIHELPYLQLMQVTHDPYASPDVSVDPNWKAAPETSWVKSWLGAPIVFNGEVQGFLALNSAEKGFYTYDYASKIKYFAQQAAIALKNARYVAEIEDLERVKSEIIHIASHDLRTPLTRIREAAQQMRDAADTPFTPKQRRALEIMLGAARDMDHIISNILSLERIEAQRREAQPIYWQKLIDKAIAGAQEELSIHNHALTVDCMPDLPVTRGNPFKLERAIYNLLHNAIKYTPPGGNIHIRAELRPYGTQNTIAIEVEDNGIGIPPEKQNGLFQPFYRVQQRSAEHIPGTGLGLSMTKAVIEEHNGNVYFDSVPGQGSLFGFWVPI